MAPQSEANLSRHYDAPTNASAQMASYTIREVPFGVPKPLRIVGIGAGASGLNMIRTLRETLPAGSFEHVVYEKNDDVGGTWLENRYPGCRCDVPSHNYQFSWRKKKDWSNLCAPAEEIRKYLADLCDDEGMRPCIRTSHKIIGATWSEESGTWQLRVQNILDDKVFNDTANFLIDASGILNKWKWPDVPGRENFKGEMVHTASWPKDFEYAGKSVALIGNGASGVQVLPAIQHDVKQLHHFIRTPAPILPPRIAMMKQGPGAAVINQIEMDSEGNFSAAQIERFKTDPKLLGLLEEILEMDSHVKFPFTLNPNGPEQKWAAGKVKEFMTMMLGGDERLCKALIPDFPLGCRRLTPAPGYLEAFRDPKVSLVTDPIRRFVESGIELESGDVIVVDAIICATGFDSSLRPPFPLVGRKGNLQDLWSKQVPKAYMSLAVPGLPNYFRFLGPNGPLSHGDVFGLSEHIANYIAAVIRKCQVQGIKTAAPSDAATRDYFEHITTFMPRTAWAGSCRSWYKQGDVSAHVLALHPGSRLHFIQMLQDVRGEDWDYTYDDKRGNRFAYLGNGFTFKEVEMLKAATPRP